MQEVEKWKQKIENHEINFNTLTQSMAAASTGWFCGQSARQAGFAATKLRPLNAKNIMTSKAITTYNQWQLRPLVCVASPLPLFWVVMRRNLLMCLAIPKSASGFTSICPWLWPGEMLPAYWPVCNFDIILPVLFLVAAFNVLITITAYHLPLYQCVAIAIRILVLSVRFIFPQLCSVTLCIGFISCQSHGLWREYSVVSCSTLLETSEALKKVKKKTHVKNSTGDTKYLIPL